MKLRKLNELGLRRFREFLGEARSVGSKKPNVPTMLLNLPTTSEEFENAPELEPFGYIARFEMARYLNEKLAHTDRVVIEGRDGLGDPGFWGAAALFYFDILVPGYKSGEEEPLADICYIPGTSEDTKVGREYRHRLAGPYRLYKLYGEFSEPLLLSPLGKQNVLYRKITDSVTYAQTRCVIEAVKRLYFDEKIHKLKEDIPSENKPGALPRLLAVVDQLDLTYDLMGMTGEMLLAQLPEEFDDWKAS